MYRPHQPRPTPYSHPSPQTVTAPRCNLAAWRPVTPTWPGVCPAWRRDHTDDPQVHWREGLPKRGACVVPTGHDFLLPGTLAQSGEGSLEGPEATENKQLCAGPPHPAPTPLALDLASFLPMPSAQVPTPPGPAPTPQTRLGRRTLSLEDTGSEGQVDASHKLLGCPEWEKTGCWSDARGRGTGPPPLPTSEVKAALQGCWPQRSAHRPREQGLLERAHLPGWERAHLPGWGAP